MTFVSEEQRYDLMEHVDVTVMAKLLHEEGLFDDTVIYHHDMNAYEMFIDSLHVLMEKYPYIKIRSNPKDDDVMFVISPSLPKSLKGCYKQTKIDIESSLQGDDYMMIEAEVKWRQNEGHVTVHHGAAYHDALDSFVQLFKKLKLKELES